MLAIVVFIALCTSTMGHMCLLAPYQRPGYVNDTELSKPGSTACGITTGPCGSVPPDQNANAAIMSEVYTVVMEKNLDHYNKNASGNFTVSLWTSGGEFLRDLGSVMDDARPSGSIYQVKINVPHEGGETKFILQAVYYTHNANAPAAFYQCADLEIYPR
eukprot:786972_1